MLSSANLSVESPASGAVWVKLVRMPAPTVTGPSFNCAASGITPVSNPVMSSVLNALRRTTRFCILVKIPRFREADPSPALLYDLVASEGCRIRLDWQPRPLGRNADTDEVAVDQDWSWPNSAWVR